MHKLKARDSATQSLRFLIRQTGRKVFPPPRVAPRTGIRNAKPFARGRARSNGLMSDSYRSRHHRHRHQDRRPWKNVMMVNSASIPVSPFSPPSSPRSRSRLRTLPACPHRAPWHDTVSAHVLPACPLGPWRPRPSSLRPASPPHPLFLGNAFPQEDAGGARGELHGGEGEGQSCQVLTMSRRLPLLPVPLVVQPPYRLCHFFANSCCLSWPLPRSQCHRTVTAGSEISPGVGEGSESLLAPIWLSETGGEPASGTVAFYPQNGIGKVV